MGKELLSQYTDLQKEIEDLRKRINKTELEIARIQMGGTVLDSVRGSRKDGTIGSIRIEGFPVVSRDAKVKRLKCYRNKLRESEIKAEELISEIETYINSIDDSRMRRIIRYRFIDKLSWNEVADMMGEDSSGEGVRKVFERF